MQTIDRKQLLHDLESVKKGLSNKDLIEQSTSFVFKDKKAITFNDEIFAMKDIELDIEGAVEADAFLKLLHKAKDKEIKIGIEDDELKIKGKKFSAGISFDNNIKLPIDEVDIPDEQKFDEVPEKFAQLIQRACLTAGKSLSQPLLTCVHIYDNVIESCDNDRITICEFDKDSTLDTDVLIPASNLLEISKEEITHVHIDDTWIHFKIEDGTVLSTRLYNEEYVDLDDQMPEEDDFDYIELPKDLSELLDRASIFSKDSISMENIVEVKIKSKKLMIKAESESKWFTEKTVVNSDQDFTFQINIDFFKDILKSTNKIAVLDDSIYFDLENSKHLIRLESEDEE